MKTFPTNLSLALFSVVLFTQSSFAQFGPAGVGNSTSNVLWLMPDKDVYTDTGITAAGNNDNIEQWNDQSGNNKHAVQATTGMRPNFITAGLNGHPAIRYTAANNDLLLSSNLLINNTASTFIIGSYTSLPSPNPGLLQGANTNSINVAPADKAIGIWVNSGTGTKLWGRAIESGGSQVNLPQNFTMASNTPYIVNSVYTTGGDLNQYVDNDLVGNNTFAGGLKSWEYMSIGHQGSESWQGDIAEVIVFNIDVNETQRILIDNYLAAKFGLTLTTNDLYTQDNLGYDYDVMGVGRLSSSDRHRNSQGKGVVRLNGVSGLGDNEWIFVGHDNGPLTTSPYAGSESANYIDRVWTSQEIGTVGDTRFRVDRDFLDSMLNISGGNNPVLIMATNAALTTGVRTFDMPRNGSYYEVTGEVNFNGTEYFSFGDGNAVVYESGAWTGGSGAGEAPNDLDLGKTVYINDAVTLTSTVSVSDIEINAPLEVAPGICLSTITATNNSTLTLRANGVTNYGQYEGPAMADVTAELYIDEDGWHDVSFPFAGTIGDLAAANAAGTFNITNSSTTQNLLSYNTELCGGVDIGFAIGAYTSEAWGTYEMPSNASLLENNAYSLFINHYFNGAPQTISFTGTTLAGTQNSTIHADMGGWNNVSNPYPVSIDFNDIVDDIDFVNANVNAVSYVWNPAANNYTTYDRATGLSINASLNTNGRFIAPFQSFFMLHNGAVNGNCGVAGVGTEGTLSIKESHRESCETPAHYNIVQKPVMYAKLQLEEVNTNAMDEMAVVFDSSYSNTYAMNEDVQKNFGGNGIHLVSLASNQPVGIGKYKYQGTYTQPVPVAATTTLGEYLTLTVIKENLMGHELWLWDKKLQLNHNLAYPYSFKLDTNWINRFELTLGKGTFTIDENKNGATFFASNVEGVDYLNVSDAYLPAQCEVYNLSGQLIKSFDLEAGENLYTLPQKVAKGIYIIQLTKDNEVHTLKY